MHSKNKEKNQVKNLHDAKLTALSAEVSSSSGFV